MPLDAGEKTPERRKKMATTVTGRTVTIYLNNGNDSSGLPVYKTQTLGTLNPSTWDETKASALVSILGQKVFSLTVGFYKTSETSTVTL